LQVMRLAASVPAASSQRTNRHSITARPARPPSANAQRPLPDKKSPPATKAGGREQHQTGNGRRLWWRSRKSPAAAP
jgi:hypothetical protein